MLLLIVLIAPFVWELISTSNFFSIFFSVIDNITTYMFWDMHLLIVELHHVFHAFDFQVEISYSIGIEILPEKH